MTAIARTRLHRSTSRAAGKAPSPTVTDTTDTSAPSCASDNPHSACSCGNVATTTCRSAKSRIISANAAVNTTRVPGTSTWPAVYPRGPRSTVPMATPRYLPAGCRVNRDTTASARVLCPTPPPVTRRPTVDSESLRSPRRCGRDGCEELRYVRINISVYVMHPTGLRRVVAVTTAPANRSDFRASQPRAQLAVHHLVRRRPRRRRDRHPEDPTALSASELLRRTIRSGRQNRTHRPRPDLRCNLRTVLAQYSTHYNGRRPHRALRLVPPRPDHPAPDPDHQRIRRRPVLGGLINEYERAALKPQVNAYTEFWNPTG